MRKKQNLFILLKQQTITTILTKIVMIKLKKQLFCLSSLLILTVKAKRTNLFSKDHRHKPNTTSCLLLTKGPTNLTTTTILTSSTTTISMFIRFRLTKTLVILVPIKLLTKEACTYTTTTTKASISSRSNTTHNNNKQHSFNTLIPNNNNNNSNKCSWCNNSSKCNNNSITLMFFRSLDLSKLSSRCRLIGKVPRHSIVLDGHSFILISQVSKINLVGCFLKTKLKV